MINEPEKNAACGGATGSSFEIPGPFHGISVGNNFACALSNSTHTARCFGLTATALAASPPSWASALSASVQYLDLSAGHDHVCLLRFSGLVDCFGQPVPGAASLSRPPANIAFASISAGEGVTCGILRAAAAGGEGNGGEIRCWADVPSNPLLNGIPAGSFIDVAVGKTHACAVSCEGKLSCWGPGTDFYSGLVSAVADYERDHDGKSPFLRVLSAGPRETCAASATQLFCAALPVDRWMMMNGGAPSTGTGATNAGEGESESAQFEYLEVSCGGLMCGTLRQITDLDADRCALGLGCPVLVPFFSAPVLAKGPALNLVPISSPLGPDTVLVTTVGGSTVYLTDPSGSVRTANVSRSFGHALMKMKDGSSGPGLLSTVYDFYLASKNESHVFAAKLHNLVRSLDRGLTFAPVFSFASELDIVQGLTTTSSGRTVVVRSHHLSSLQISRDYGAPGTFSQPMNLISQVPANAVVVKVAMSDNDDTNSGDTTLAVALFIRSSSDNSAIFISKDNGLTFSYTKQVSVDPLAFIPTDFRGIAVSNDGQIIYAVQNLVGLLKSTDGGATFDDAAVVPLGASQYRDVLTCGDGSSVFVLDWDFNLQVSTDFGATFQPYTRGAPAGRFWSAALSRDCRHFYATSSQPRVPLFAARPLCFSKDCVPSLHVTTRTALGDSDAVFFPRRQPVAAPDSLLVITAASAVLTASTLTLGPAQLAGLPSWALGLVLNPAPNEIKSGAFKWQGSCTRLLSEVAFPNPRPPSGALKLNAGSFDGLDAMKSLNLSSTGAYSGTTPGVISVGAFLPSFSSALSQVFLQSNGISQLVPAETTLTPAPRIEGVSQFRLYLDNNAFSDVMSFSEGARQIFSASAASAGFATGLLSLDGNSLTTVRRLASFARGFEKLDQLNLRKNKLSFIEEGSFTSLGNPLLTTLRTDGNLLEQPCRQGYFNKLISFTTPVGGSINYVACSPCPPGSFCNGGVMTACPVGTFSNALFATDVSTCEGCPVGTYSALEGQTRVGCIPCSPGFASNATGAFSAESCQRCERGTYSAIPRLPTLPCRPLWPWRQGAAGIRLQSLSSRILFQRPRAGFDYRLCEL